jgi:peptide chain release factor 3
VTLSEEIARRKTFAIISHPDAGKTTLTEKFLLFAGAIQSAGAVKSRKIRQSTVSDFMAIEKERGISVASAVMSFEYGGRRINLLDTPGHKDFAEDTYRTLSAVDSVVLVVDSVKGVEEQTEKLMAVCRMRDTPVIIFVNKLDREGPTPVDILDELEAKLAIKVCPLTWPISRGSDFKGVYNLHKDTLNLFRPHEGREADDLMGVSGLDDPLLDEKIGTDHAARLREDAELAGGIYGRFNPEAYLSGQTAPVFFGSALNNFGVKELLETFVEIAPGPRGRPAKTRVVAPDEPKFTGFAFKIHANLDLKHRDRIVFFRVCSGRFERGAYYTHTRLGIQLRFQTPASFLGQKKDIIDEAYPGDVIGLYDRGNFKIGDTLTEGESLMFEGVPNFSPEVFGELVKTTEKVKQLNKGIEQLTDEGVAQLFTAGEGRRKIVGTVGRLQFDVIKYRLAAEYDAECRFEPLNYHKACWISSTDPVQLEAFMSYMDRHIAFDKDGKPVFFAETDWTLNYCREKYPALEFHTTSEFGKNQRAV